MDSNGIRVSRIGPDHTLAALEELRGTFRLVAGPGSGYSCVTELHGDHVRLEPTALSEWDGGVLVVMRVFLSPAEAAVLEGLGVEAAFDAVRRLETGEAILLER